MTTAERIRLLRRHGLENAVIAAVLGVNCDAIADHIADPSIDVAIPGGGGGGDVSGLLPLDGSRAMTGPLAFEDGTRLFLADSGTVQLDGGGPGQTAYLYATNESSLYADDLQEGWFYPGAVDLADFRYSHLARLRTSNDIDHGLYVSRPGQDAIYGPDGLWFNQVAGVPATSLFNTAPGVLELDNTLSFKGVDGDAQGGATIAWDDDAYGLVLKGRPGSGDSELYVMNPDVAPFAAYSIVTATSVSVADLTQYSWEEPDGFHFTKSGAAGAGRVSHGIGGAGYDNGYGMLYLTRDGGAGDHPDIYVDLWNGQYGVGFWREFTVKAGGVLGWHSGAYAPDVTLQRAAAGVLEIPQHGGGFKLTSPDGSQTKTLRLSNAGALELV